MIVQKTESRPSTIRTIWYEGTCDGCNTAVNFGNRGFEIDTTQPYYCNVCSLELRRYTAALMAKDLEGAEVVAVTLEHKQDEIDCVTIQTKTGQTYDILWYLRDKEED